MKTRIETTQFECTYGRKPRGRRTWAFAIDGAVLTKTGLLSEVMKAVIAEFPNAGKVEVLP
jgi:hypothetical protein